jgi:hypothetical protein
MLSKGTPPPGGYIKNIYKTKLYKEKVHEISIKNHANKKFPERAILMKKCAKIGKYSRSGHFVKKSKKIVKNVALHQNVSYNVQTKGKP